MENENFKFKVGDMVITKVNHTRDFKLSHIYMILANFAKCRIATKKHVPCYKVLTLKHYSKKEGFGHIKEFSCAYLHEYYELFKEI